MPRHFRSIIRGGLYLTLAMPLLFINYTFFPAHFGKTIVFQMMVEALLGLHCWTVWSEGGAGKRLREWIKSWRALDWAIIILAAVFIVTSFTGVNLANSFWGNQARVNGVFTWLHFIAWYFLLRAAFKNQADWRRLLTIASAVATFVAFSVLFEHYLPAAWQSGSGGGIIGNRAFAASYLLAGLGLSGYAIATSRGPSRAGFIFAAVVSAAALFFTGNRGSLVGLAVGVVAALILVVVSPKWRRARLAAAGILAALLIFTVMLAGLARQEYWHQQFPRLLNVFSIGQYFSGTGETRLLAWVSALQGWRERPLLGWGMGNYDIIFNKYYNSRFLKFSFSETVWDKPHNWFLEVASGAGILGLASYLGILILALYYLGLAVRRTDGEANYSAPTASIILFGALIAYAAQSLFLFETSNSLLLFFLLLFFARATRLDAARNIPAGYVRPADGYKYGVGVIIFAALIFSLYWFNYLPLKASHFLRLAHDAADSAAWAANAEQALAVPVPFKNELEIFLAERFTDLQKAGADVTASATVAIASQVAGELSAAGVRYPENPLFPVWAGQIYLALGESIFSSYYARASEQLTLANERAPKKQEFLFFLGRLELLRKNFARAIDYQKRAVALAPEIGISHWFLGLSYVASGQTKEGIGEIDRTKTLGYNLNRQQELYVLDLYAQERMLDKVIAGYQNLVAVEPDNVNWYIKLAAAYAEAGKKAEALAVVRQAVGLYPPLQSAADEFIKKYHLN